MFKITVTPQIKDIDGLRHVNNNAVIDWFELGRNDIFRIFTPDLDLRYENWELILVRTETDYVGQMFFNYNVEISIEKSEFPTKHYGDISLPAGTYDALKGKIR